jgi:uncharacterized protein (UPF0261 family)
MSNKLRGNIFTAFDHITENATSLHFDYMDNTHPMNIYITGALGGGNVTIEALAPDGTYVPVVDLTFAEVGMYTIGVFPFIGRCVLANSAAANVSVYLQGSVRPIEDV